LIATIPGALSRRQPVDFCFLLFHTGAIVYTNFRLSVQARNRHLIFQPSRTFPTEDMIPFRTRFAFFSSALALVTVLLAGGAAAGDPALIRIGYQKYGTFNVVRAHGELDKALNEKGKKVQWLLFSAGPQLLEALNAGSIDVGNTGEAPPIFAQVANPSLLYLGDQPPFPDGEALLVPKSSSVTSVADLKGKKVVLNKGSNVHYFLVKALEKAGLKYSDVQTAFLSPPDARAAFESGSVDAWAIWEPFLTAAVQGAGAKVLTDAKGLAANREFFLSTRGFVEKNPDFVPALAAAVDSAGKWVAASPAEVSTYLAKEIGMDSQILQPIIQRAPWGFRRLDAAVIADQQAIADLFFSLKLIPKPISVADAVARTLDSASIGK
jgi:sulfonate transport system substrate-binding protein